MSTWQSLENSNVNGMQACAEEVSISDMSRQHTVLKRSALAMCVGNSVLKKSAVAMCPNNTLC